MNEGFATYTEWWGADKAKPEWQVRSLFTTWVMQDALRDDSVSVSRAINDKVHTDGEIISAANDITYFKGQFSKRTNLATDFGRQALV